MLAYIVSSLIQKTIMLNKSNTTFTLLDSHIQVLFLNHEYYLRLPHNLKYVYKNAVKHGNFVCIRNIKNEQEAYIYFSQYEENFDVFQKYKINKNTIIIGSQIDNDIYIQDANIKSSEFVLDLEHSRIIDNYSGSKMSTNHKIINDCMIHSGDVIQILNLKIIYHPEFLMINTCENIYHEFQVFIPDDIEYPLEKTERKEIYYHYRNIHIVKNIHIVLDEPLQNRNREFNPLIFSMGPAITMSSASFLSGLISLYNGYLNGRELYELYPMVLLPTVMLISSLFWNPMQRIFDKHKDTKFNKERKVEYKKYLAQISLDIDCFKNNLTRQLVNSFPDLEILYTFQNEDELFQRCDKYDDYLMFRLGIGNDKLLISYEQKFHLKKNDPVLNLIVDLKEKEKYINNTVITFSLLDYSRVTYCNKNNFIPFLNRILLQITYFYSKEKYAVAFLCDKSWISEHKDYLNIPHIYNSSYSFRYIACNEKDVDSILTMQKNENKYLFVIVQKYSLAKNLNIENGSIIYLSDGRYLPSNSNLFIHETNDEGLIEYSSYSIQYKCDSIEGFNMNHYFMKNNEYYLKDKILNINHPTLFDLYHIHTVEELNIQDEYQKNKDSLEAVIGIDTNNDPLILDLSEKGNGPHGLIAGTTGSGKSEFIITLILSFALRYHPSLLQFVLIDFKGGGIASVLATNHLYLPHIIGVLDNLDSNEIDRALFSFKNECKKREELFQKMTIFCGKPVNHLSIYQKEWKKECGLPSLSDLVIIIDEFAELKIEYPDFLQDLISISRVGRSLGIHLILVTQKPAGIVNDQIWSNCHFKICLKVQEKQDSREILHRDDAATIYDPGEFYFLSDDHFVHAKSGYANAPVDLNEKEIQIIDYKYEVIAENKITKTSKTQAKAIIEEINRCLENDTYICNPLWLAALSEISCNDVVYDKAYFGLVDDYYHNKQDYLYLKRESEYYFIISPYFEERVAFIYTVLYALFKTIEKKDEIYVIDDLSIVKDDFVRVAQFISLFNSSDTKKSNKLFEHIKEKKDLTVHTTIIITDLYSFLQSQSARNLHELLEIGARKNCSILLFSANSTVLHYREKLLINHNLTLRNENLQDISALFELPIKKKVTVSHQGMIRKENILLFQFIHVDERNLLTCIEENYKQYQGIKPYILPSIPEKISYCNYRGNELPLGISLKTYNWVCIPKESQLLVISTYENELYDFYYVLKETELPVLYLPNKEKIIKSFQEKSSIVFITVDKYQSISKEIKENIPILYIGSGIHEQYTIRYMLKEKLASNEALFMYKDRREVIQIVEKYN